MQRSLPVLALVAIALLFAACSKTAPVSASVDTPAIISLEDAQVTHTGTFSGRSDHVVTGGVEILESGGDHFLRLAADFTLDGAPDPVVGFGRAGAYDEASTVAPLRSHGGEQVYDLPDGFELGTLDEAYIWCGDFSVPLGVAQLEAR